jgi:saccharopine dehydrogenase-like NADP-dependent oxidoreductase
METKRVLILGAGLVGRPMALDLAKNNEFIVGIADISEDRLKPFNGSQITTHQADLSNAEILRGLMGDYDLFINAVPGSMGFSTLRNLITAGKPVIDIAFYPENPFELSNLALQHGSCVICDMGVAPGMSHLLTGYAASKMDSVSKVLIYVGGLPKVRLQPWEYKAVFSPSDVIEEYLRPARLVEHGQMVVKEALSESEFLDFDHVGTLEAFNSDGLRSLVTTIKADYMAEKTLRYPGHIDKIKLLKSAGFFDEKPLLINGTNVTPRELTQKVLFPQWNLMPGEEDLTVMKIKVEGKSSGKSITHTFDLYDEYDPDNGVHSMARTTGYAATVALRMAANGYFTEPGIHLPENIGKNESLVRFILKGLQERNINYIHRIL